MHGFYRIVRDIIYKAIHYKRFLGDKIKRTFLSFPTVNKFTGLLFSKFPVNVKSQPHNFGICFLTVRLRPRVASPNTFD